MAMDDTWDQAFRDIRKLNTDVYFGDGPKNPSITVRLATMEDAIKDIKWMKRMVTGTFFTVLGGVALWLLTGRPH